MIVTLPLPSKTSTDDRSTSTRRVMYPVLQLHRRELHAGEARAEADVPGLGAVDVDATAVDVVADLGALSVPVRTRRPKFSALRARNFATISTVSPLARGLVSLVVPSTNLVDFNL